MSLFRNLFASAMFGVMLTAGVFVAAPVFAAETAEDPCTSGGAISKQYCSIRSEGLIFANLCDGTFHTGDTTAAGGTCACRDQGKCSLEQVLQMFVNVSYLVLALSGSAALIAFVYGGFEWILSAGYSERVDRGKKAIVGAAVGLVIVFGAYVFINLVISILKVGAPATNTIENTIGGDAGTIIKSE